MHVCVSVCYYYYVDVCMFVRVLSVFGGQVDWSQSNRRGQSVGSQSRTPSDSDLTSLIIRHLIIFITSFLTLIFKLLLATYSLFFLLSSSSKKKSLAFPLLHSFSVTFRDPLTNSTVLLFVKFSKKNCLFPYSIMVQLCYVYYCSPASIFLFCFFFLN